MDADGPLMEQPNSRFFKHREQKRTQDPTPAWANRRSVAFSSRRSMGLWARTAAITAKRGILAKVPSSQRIRTRNLSTLLAGAARSEY